LPPFAAPSGVDASGLSGKALSALLAHPVRGKSAATIALVAIVVSRAGKFRCMCGSLSAAAQHRGLTALDEAEEREVK
jgi:hypothetical protein